VEKDENRFLQHGKNFFNLLYTWQGNSTCIIVVTEDKCEVITAAAATTAAKAFINIKQKW
jgi:hypothetical protein